MALSPNTIIQVLFFDNKNNYNLELHELVTKLKNKGEDQRYIDNFVYELSVRKRAFTRNAEYRIKD